MVIVEFVIFVVSSGLFCSSRFRHHVWAVWIAGGLAAASSLLFAYDLVERLAVPTEAPVRVVKQVVQIPVPVMQRVSQPPSLAKPRSCRDDYPFFARILGHEGTTEVAFQVMADGTVTNAKVAKSSGYDGLDDAAVECVAQWHYRPAIRDNQLVDAPMNVKVIWNLDEDDDKSGKPAKPEKPASAPPANAPPAPAPATPAPATEDGP